MRLDDVSAETVVRRQASGETGVRHGGEVYPAAPDASRLTPDAFPGPALVLVVLALTFGCAPSPQQTAKDTITQLGGKTRSDQGQVVMVALRKSRATDNDLAMLRQFPALDRLSLPSAITDAGLKHLEGLPLLTSLDLQNTQVSDEGLSVIKTLPKLAQLYIHGSRITEAGADSLQKDLPKLTIEKFPVAPLGPDFR